MRTTLAYTEDSIYSDDAVVVRIYDPRPRYFRGGLHTHAEAVRRAGRYGDDVLLHVTPDEFKQLHDAWGEPTVNPHTGLPEYGLLSKIGKGLKSVGNKLGSGVKSVLKNPIVQKLGPIAASIFLPGVGGLIATAALGAANAKLNGGKGSDLLKGAAMGAAGHFITGGGMGVGDAATHPLASLIGKVDPSGTMAKFAGVGGAPGAAGAASGAGGAMMDEAGMPIGGTAGAAGASGPGGFLAGAKKFFTNPDTGKPAWGKIAGTAAGTLALLHAASPKQPSPPPGYGSNDPNFNKPLPQLTFNRQRNDAGPDYYHYGHGDSGEFQFFSPNALPQPAQPGLADGGGVSGPGSGRSDDIDAKLSNGEYIMDAETVSLLGDGSTDEGSRRLDEMRNNLRRHKGRNLAKGRFSHTAKRPERYLPKIKKKRGGVLRRAEGGPVQSTGAMRRLNQLADQFQKALNEGDSDTVTRLTKPLTALHPDSMKTGYEAFAQGGSVADAIRKLISRAPEDRRVAPRVTPERRSPLLDYPNSNQDLGAVADQLRTLNPDSNILRQYEFEKNKRKLGNTKDIYDMLMEEPQ